MLSVIWLRSARASSDVGACSLDSRSLCFPQGVMRKLSFAIFAFGLLEARDADACIFDVWNLYQYGRQRRVIGSWKMYKDGSASVALSAAAAYTLSQAILLMQSSSICRKG